MELQNKINAAITERNRIQYAPASEFSEAEPKFIQLRNINEKISLLEKEKRNNLLLRSSRNEVSESLKKKLGYEIIKFSEEEINDTTEKIMRSHNISFDSEKLKSFQVKDLIKSSLTEFSALIDKVSSISSFNLKIALSTKLIILLSRKMELISKLQMDVKEAVRNLQFVIGEVLKFRVEMATDIILHFAEVDGPQDIPFFSMFDIDSVRTPDYLERVADDVYLMETNFSSRRVKGKFSKGLVPDQSKYYEEMYYLKTRFNLNVYYFPVIFFQGMSEYSWKSNVEVFLGEDEIGYSEVDISNFFRSVKQFYNKKSVNLSKRKMMTEVLFDFLSLADVLGDQIYPRGKIMNNCFTIINNPENSYEILETEFKVKKVVEYNRRHVEEFLEIIGYPSLIDLFDYSFSGNRTNVDCLSVKKGAFLLAKEMETIIKNDNFPMDNNVDKLLRQFRDFIFEDVGISNFGKNSRRENLQFLINFEKLGDLYFGMISDVVEEKFSSALSIDGETVKVPYFRFIENLKPPMDKELARKEEVQFIRWRKFDNVNINVTDVKLSDEDAKIDLTEMNKVVEIHSSDLKKFLDEEKRLPNIPMIVYEPDNFTRVLEAFIKLFKSENESTKQMFKDYQRISISEAISEGFNEMKDSDFSILVNLEKDYVVEFYDHETQILFYSEGPNDKIFELSSGNLKLVKTGRRISSVNQFRNELNGLTDDFQRLNFNRVKGKYLSDVGNINRNTDDVVDKMKDLIISQEKLSTGRTKSVCFDEVLSELPDGNLKYSEPFFIDPPLFDESGDIVNGIVLKSDFINSKKRIELLREKAKEDGYVKFKGMKFFEDHVEIKGVKTSYHTESFLKLMNTSTKIRKNPKLNDSLIKVIEKCQSKKSSKLENKLPVEKVFKPDKGQIEELELRIDSMSGLEEDSRMNFTMFDSNLQGLSDSKKILIQYEDMLNKNLIVKGLFRLSKLYESMAFEVSKWKISKDEILISDENFKNMAYIVLPSNKVTNDLTKVRYMIVINAEKVSADSIFKNDLGGGYFSTNVHEEDIEQIKFRANCFSNVYNLCLYQWKKRIFSDHQVICSFIKIYMLLFTLGTNTKNILSVFKYLNIINFSDFSNPKNLFKKYFMKDKHNKTIHYLFMRQIIENFNHNLKSVEKFSGSEELIPVRNKPIMCLLKGIFGDCFTIKDLIEQNTFYNLVEKKTTNNFHSNSKFIQTIIENNTFLESTKKSGYFLDEIDSEFLKLDSKSFFCKEAIYHGCKLIMKDIFDSKNVIDSKDKVLTENFERCRQKKLLDKKFFTDTMTERIYSRFSSTFLSSRKSLKIDNSSKSKSKSCKQRMIDSTIEYINEIYGNSDRVSPVDLFEKTMEMIENDEKFRGVPMKDLSHLSCLAKKEQHEGDREIYILFIVTKILTVYIQTFFYSLNMLVRGEMVVKPTISKFSLIKDMTSEIYQMHPGTEIIFMNGDMASWSGRDIYEKFFFLIDSLNDIGQVDEDVLNAVKFCFIFSNQMKIIVPDNQSDKTNEIDPYFGKPCLTYTHSWPQGIYHNPSSFVHACEQRLKTEILKSKLKKDFSHKFLDHSDDKNEIINLKIEDYETYVKISNFSPSFFSLKPSQTKDSFSRIVSEMVGVQNIKGRIFDNPVKSMRNITNSVKSPFFIINYKSALSAISGFYDKSCDLVMSNCLNILSYSYLTKSFGIKSEEVSVLPLDFGGFLNSDFDSYNRYGSQSDIVSKFGELKSKGVSLNRIYKELSLVAKFKMDDNMKKMKKSLNKYKRTEKLKFDLDTQKDEFVSNILRSKVSERIEMFRKRDTLTDILNLRNQNHNKVFLSFQDKLMPVPQNRLHEILNSMKIFNDETLDNSLVYDEKIFSSVNLVKSRKLIPHKLDEEQDIRNLNNFSMTETRLHLGIKYLDFETLEDVVTGKFKRIFKSFSNRGILNDIANESELILQHFNINTIDEFSLKKNLVKQMLDSNKNKNLVQFRPIIEDVVESTDFYNEIEFKEDTFNQLMGSLSDFVPKILPLIDKRSRSVEALDKLKNYLNERLINDENFSEEVVKEILSESQASRYELMRATKNDYLKLLLNYIFRSKLNNLKDDELGSELSTRRRYKIKLIERNSEEEFKIFLVKSISGSLVDVCVTVKNIDFYFILNNDNNEIVEIAKKLFKSSKMKRIEKKSHEIYRLILEILETEGIVYLQDKNKIVISKVKEDNSVSRIGNTLLTTNPVTGDRYSLTLNLFTESSSFKSQIFRTTRIETTMNGGKLTTLEDFNNFDIRYIQPFKIELEINKKFLAVFNGTIKNELKQRISCCSVGCEHDHDPREPVICLRNRIFRMLDRENGEIVSVDIARIESSLSRASEETGLIIDLKTMKDYRLKTDLAQKKGKWLGGEIIACPGVNYRNLANVKYIIPDDTTEIVNCLNIIYEGIRLTNSRGVVDTKVHKENINVFRTINCIFNNDRRFGRNIRSREKLLDDVEITRLVRANWRDDDSLMDYLFFSKIESLVNSESLTGKVGSILSLYFDFSIDKRYHHSYLRWEDILFSKDDGEIKSALEKDKKIIEKDLDNLKKEVKKMSQEKDKFIPIEYVERTIEAKLEEFKKVETDKIQTEKISRESRITSLESQISFLKKKLEEKELSENALFKEIETLKKELEMSRSKESKDVSSSGSQESFQLGKGGYYSETESDCALGIQKSVSSESRKVARLIRKLKVRENKSARKTEELLKKEKESQVWMEVEKLIEENKKILNGPSDLISTYHRDIPSRSEGFTVESIVKLNLNDLSSSLADKEDPKRYLRSIKLVSNFIRDIQNFSESIRQSDPAVRIKAMNVLLGSNSILAELLKSEDKPTLEIPLDVTNILKEGVQSLMSELTTLARFRYPNEFFKEDPVRIMTAKLSTKQNIDKAASIKYIEECKSRLRSLENLRGILNLMSSLRRKLRFPDDVLEKELRELEPEKALEFAKRWRQSFEMTLFGDWFDTCLGRCHLVYDSVIDSLKNLN